MKTDLQVDWCSHKAATYACKNWHYARISPMGKLVKVGAWEGEKFIGAVIFGRGASPFLGKKYSLAQCECVELVRIALTSHKTPVSQIVSIALKFLKKRNPNIMLVVSFADPEKGHHGGIYQAGNWIYTGTSAATQELFVKNRWTHLRGAYHQKTVHTRTRTMPGKHRYLMPLDKETRERVKHMAKPYPKRVTKASSGIQSESGGAIPTGTLHLIPDNKENVA